MSQPKKSTVLSKKLSPPFDITQECDNSGSFPMFLDTPGKSTKAESQASATEGSGDPQSSPSPSTIINHLCDSENHLKSLSLVWLIKITFLPISPNCCKYQSR